MQGGFFIFMNYWRNEILINAGEAKRKKVKTINNFSLSPFRQKKLHEKGRNKIWIRSV